MAEPVDVDNLFGDDSDSDAEPEQPKQDAAAADKRSKLAELANRKRKEQVGSIIG